MTRELDARRVVFLLALVAIAAAYLLVSLTNLVSGALTARAATAPSGSFGTITIGGTDTIYNWDFNSSSVSSDNVDWGLRFIFWDNAEVDYVKDRLDGEGNDPWIYPQLNSLYKGSKYAYVDDGPEEGPYSNFIDADRGIRDWPGCVDNWGHMRVYARTETDRNYSPGWGYYVVASSHVDKELASEDTCDRSFKSEETHEDKWVDRIEDHLSDSPYNWDVDGYKDFGNASSLVNTAATDEPPQWYQSDGYGRTVQVSGNK